MMTGLTLLGAVLMAVGLAGTILPLLPGAPLAFIGAVLIAWAQDFERIGVWTLGLLGVLTILTIVVDFIATALGAKKTGASSYAIVGATLGTIGGIFFALPGIILGPFVGAFAGELLHRRDFGQAGKVGIGTWLGLIIGSAFKFALVLSMVVITVVAQVL